MTASTPNSRLEAHAARRAHYLAGLIWHLGAFVIVNVLLWLVDFGLGQDGAQWAYWFTAGWGFGLTFHALAYLVDGSQLEARMARKYLALDDRQKVGV